MLFVELYQALSLGSVSNSPSWNCIKYYSSGLYFWFVHLLHVSASYPSNCAADLENPVVKHSMFIVLRLCSVSVDNEFVYSLKTTCHLWKVLKAYRKESVLIDPRVPKSKLSSHRPFPSQLHTQIMKREFSTTFGAFLDLRRRWWLTTSASVARLP